MHAGRWHAGSSLGRVAFTRGFGPADGIKFPKIILTKRYIKQLYLGNSETNTEGRKEEYIT